MRTTKLFMQGAVLYSSANLCNTVSAVSSSSVFLVCTCCWHLYEELTGTSGYISTCILCSEICHTLLFRYFMAPRHPYRWFYSTPRRNKFQKRWEVSKSSHQHTCALHIILKCAKLKGHGIFFRQQIYYFTEGRACV